MFGWFKNKAIVKKNEWVCINKFWGQDKYIEELVRFPDDERKVDLSVVNGNVGHGMKGYYINGEWWTDDWNPVQKSFKRKMRGGVSVVAWRDTPYEGD